jgi:hypothetical protein
MAQRPSFGTLKKAKPALDVAPRSDESSADSERPSKAAPPRIQTSVRLDPAMWAALNDLATRKRIEDGRRVTVHDLLIEGGRHVLAVNGIKMAE